MNLVEFLSRIERKVDYMRNVAIDASGHATFVRYITRQN